MPPQVECLQYTDAPSAPDQVDPSMVGFKNICGLWVGYTLRLTLVSDGSPYTFTGVLSPTFATIWDKYIFTDGQILDQHEVPAGTTSQDILPEGVSLVRVRA